ncbi:hypothetical protein DFJ74DRAFT_722379, partial [Hyaloraphidium curvatum]
PAPRRESDRPRTMFSSMGSTAGPKLLFRLVLAFLLAFAFWSLSPPSPHIPALGGLPPANATLDLSEILVISLPAAKARRRMLSDLARLSGLRLTFVDAVGPGSAEIDLTRRVLGDRVAELRDYEIAIWWSHHRAWTRAADLASRPHASFARRRMHEIASNRTERIGAGEPKVLILEDDVDWELDVRSRFSHLLRAVPRWGVEGDPPRAVEGADMLYVGWCFEENVSVPLESWRGKSRVLGEVRVPAGDSGDPPARTYALARPIFPCCQHAYILTASAAAHLALTSLPHHALTSRFPAPYLPGKRWAAVDIHVANGPAKEHLRAAVVHPPLFRQLPEGAKPQGEGLLRGARGEYWKKRGGREGEESQFKLIEAERGEEMGNAGKRGKDRKEKDGEKEG